MKLIWTFCFAIHCFILISQSQPKSSSELYEDLKRLENTATVMYVAAHPDDENTRLISWLENARHVNTVYLSLTRGDGGQNLIGTEKGDLLGVLRTQELLEARKIDGGKQWFTRAIDFGYSKTATESLQIWDKEEILGDVVWAIRLHRPDVIITRFDPNSNGETHGHHTSSAILAEEAFDLAGDPNAYPEQLQHVETWQPRRLFFNTSWWFFGSRENFEKADKSDMLSIDVGEYLPILGISNNEIASLSRSKHACQGFGSALQRGSETEWLKLLKGDMPDNGDLLQGVAPTLNDQMQKKIENIIDHFDFRKPYLSTKPLLELYQESEIKNLPSEKKDQLRDLILATQGIYTELVTSQSYAVEGDSIDLQLEVTNRGNTDVVLREIGAKEHDLEALRIIRPNERFEQIFSTLVNGKISSPYWLEETPTGMGMYTVHDQKNIGKPENAVSMSKSVALVIQGVPIGIEIPVSTKNVDRAKGEIYEPFYIVPPVAVNLLEPVYLFSDNESQTITAKVTSFTDQASGMVKLENGEHWNISEAKPFSIARKGESQFVNFTVTPPAEQNISELKASATYKGTTYSNSYEVVNYDHIDKQVLFRPSTAKIGKIKMQVPDVKVGYIQGSGDDVPQSLRQVGVNVTEISESQWNNLTNFDVVMVGIRAFNVLENGNLLAERIKNFAENGGTVIVQYQTSRGLETEDFAPFTLQLGRERISQENANLKFLYPEHRLLNSPNQITQADFEDWVQERGLYFANNWSEEYTPIFEGNDLGETPKQGSLLIAEVGQGVFVYTGLSFFRELPAGVPGAYRLMMNLLAL